MYCLSGGGSIYMCVNNKSVHRSKDLRQRFVFIGLFCVTAFQMIG